MPIQTKKKLPSGHELTINHVSLAAASALRRAVARELQKIQVGFSEAMIPALLSQKKENIAAALSGTDLNTLKDLLLGFLASEEIEILVMGCMAKWSLDGEAVTPETFEPDDRRGDFIPCAVEVGRYALLPFFGSLVSPSSSQSNETSAAPK
jgi:hypothetical protein